MTAAAKQPYDDLYFSARDGLRLYGRHYKAAAKSKRRPVLCLAGLTRNSRDFHDIALALSQHPATPRDVYTVDMRGRGLSDNDKDWRNYAIPIELQDVIDFMTMTGLHDAGIVGTSRGGLITHVLAAAQPTRIGAVVLNDIGPVIDIDGLVRIAGYVGRTPMPQSWDDAARLVKNLTKRDFPDMTDKAAEALARQLFNERNGRPSPGYDPQLSKCLSVLDGPIPELWPQFEGLKRVPVMVVRGGNSDLLSRKTVAEMQHRHPRLTSIEVPGEGHAPLLQDAPTIDAITAFFADADSTMHSAAA
jgi:pimeloyl-ACP methyl ester carboxylesterase